MKAVSEPTETIVSCICLLDTPVLKEVASHDVLEKDFAEKIFEGSIRCK